jgi:hypothetical protein
MFVSDFDDDGDLDLAVSRNAADTLVILLNQPVPRIIATSPVQNELNVSVDSGISVTFDIDMDSTTINDSTFVVNARSTGLRSGGFSYDIQSKTATFNPSTDFDEGEVVTVVLTTGIESSHGIPLDNSYIWCFTVAVSDNSPGTFLPDSTYSISDSPHPIFGADFDNDGDIDIASSSYSSGVLVLLNNGDGTRG